MLLFVPPALFTTADSDWSCPEAGELQKWYGLPDWLLLATYLISEASLMSSSRWNNYISALPRQPSSLLYWTRSELDIYLEASQIRQRAIERTNDVTGTYNNLGDRIFVKHPVLFPDEVETFLDYDKSSRGVVFTDGSSISARKSNGELLLSYGFIPKEGTNPHDSVELSLSLKESDKCYKEKLEALRKYDLSASQRFPLQITGWPLELMAFAYLVVSPPNLANQIDEILRRRQRDLRSGELRALRIFDGFR